MAGLRADEDWVIRRYAPLTVIGRDSLPVFSTSVLRAASREFGEWKRGVLVRKQVGHVQERLIDFRSTARVSLSASELLRIAEWPAFRERGPLRNKIVLIGGDYRAARDEHLTPLGMMSGVDIWAQVIETELGGGGFVPPHWLWPVTLQLLSVALVILLFRTASLRVAVLAGALALPVLAMICARLAFGSVWHALYFFPSMIVVLFWELYDRASDYLKALKQQQRSMG